jgi:glutamate/aspartate transport system substrate-binding protein
MPLGRKIMRQFLLGFLMLCLPLSMATAAGLSGTLKKINDRGQINLGYRISTAPMSFQDPDGKPVGYSIDLCQAVVAAVKKKLGKPSLKVKYVAVTSKDRFKAITSGKTDILCGATTKTLKRSERVGFSQLTFVTGGSLLSIRGNEVAGVKSASGKKVAVVSNTTTIEALKAAAKKNASDIKIVSVTSAKEGMEMLDNGDVDAFSADQVVLIGQVISRNNTKEYALSKQLFSIEPFALALPRGDADFRLVADRALSDVFRTGQIKEIYARWFGRFGQKPAPALLSLYHLNATPES